MPTDDEMQAALYVLEREFKGLARWRLADDFDKRSSFDRAISRIDMSSSPGYPYLLEKPTNGEWLGFDGVFCDAFRLDRLWYDVKLVLRDEWDTVLRSFVKQEPHNPAKVKQGRWRLIMAAPLCVQVAWQMLFGQMNDLEIDNSLFLPTQQGIVLPRGGWKQYLAQWKCLGLNRGVDKSAWDWTCPMWAIRMDLEFRYRNGSGGRMQDWLTISRILYRHMFEDPKIIVSSGQVFQQTVPGVMKSGCVSTISINGHAQLFLHIIVSNRMGTPVLPLPRVCGDDTLHSVVHLSSGVIDEYARLGVVIKGVSEHAEFVGHTFEETGPVPCYFPKHFKKVAYVKEPDLAAYLDSMARMYVHTHYYGFWEELSWKLNKPLPLSRWAYKRWYDYSD